MLGSLKSHKQKCDEDENYLHDLACPGLSFSDSGRVGFNLKAKGTHCCTSVRWISECFGCNSIKTHCHGRSNNKDVTRWSQRTASSFLCLSSSALLLPACLHSQPLYIQPRTTSPKLHDMRVEYAASST